jgi:hypothetical protein
MAISSQYPENTLTPLLASSNRRVDRFPDLAVITSHFNPCDYEMPRRNYLRFAAALRVQGVRLFTIELAFGSHPFFLQQSTDCIRLRTNHILWHKERLLNLMLDHVPGQFDKIAWVDADILFEDPNWVQSARDLLTNCLVVQLFSHATYLGKHGEPISSVQGVADRMGIMSFPEGGTFYRNANYLILKYLAAQMQVSWQQCTETMSIRMQMQVVHYLKNVCDGGWGRFFRWSVAMSGPFHLEFIICGMEVQSTGNI